MKMQVRQRKKVPDSSAGTTSSMARALTLRFLVFFKHGCCDFVSWFFKHGAVISFLVSLILRSGKVFGFGYTSMWLAFHGHDFFSLFL